MQSALPRVSARRAAHSHTHTPPFFFVCLLFLLPFAFCQRFGFAYALPGRRVDMLPTLDHILAHRWRNIFQFFNTFGWQQQNAAHIFPSCQHISCRPVGGRDAMRRGGGAEVAACAFLAMMLQRQRQRQLQLPTAATWADANSKQAMCHGHAHRPNSTLIDKGKRDAAAADAVSETARRRKCGRGQQGWAPG